MKITLLFLALLLSTYSNFSRAERPYQDYYDRVKLPGYFQTAPSAGGNIHVVLVIDTNGHNAEAVGMAEDGKAFVKLLTGLFPDGANGTHRLYLEVLAGASVRRQRILDTIAALNSNSNDTLLFYFSGHGGTEQATVSHWLEGNNQITPEGHRYDSDVGHFLALGSGEDAETIERAEIKAALAAKAGQLRILITDSCGSFPSRGEALRAVRSASSSLPITKSEILEDAKQNPATVDAQSKLINALFFNSVGWVSINAAPPGMTAPGSRAGGIYTRSLLAKIQELSEELNTDDWDRSVWRGKLGEVPIKKVDPNEPYLNPNGAQNGLHDPRYIYSRLFATDETISYVRASLRR